MTPPVNDNALEFDRSIFLEHRKQRCSDSIGGRLRVLRERLGLTPAEFAEKLGYTSKRYKAFEAGTAKRFWTYFIYRIGTTVDVSISWLMMGRIAGTVYPVPMDAAGQPIRFKPRLVR